MPKKITAAEYEAVIAGHCDALRTHIALLAQDHSMSPAMFDSVSRLLRIKSEVIEAERALKEKAESERSELIAALGDAIAICREHGLHVRLQRAVEVQNKYGRRHGQIAPPPDVSRWN